MRRIEMRAMCLTAPDRWAKQYHNTTLPEKAAITQALMAMPVSDLTPESIAKVIGNESWTCVDCDECGSNAAEGGVEFEDFALCRRCVEKAWELL